MRNIIINQNNTNTLQTRDKNDLLRRLGAYLNQHGQTTVNNPGRPDFERWLRNELHHEGSRGTYLRTIDRQEFDELLQFHAINNGIYACQDLNALFKAFEDVGNDSTVAAQRAKNYGKGNMVSAFRYYIEFLLYMNRITI